MMNHFRKATRWATTLGQGVIEDMLDGVPITRLTREPAPAVSPDLPVSTLVYDHVMRGEGRAFPVVQNGKLLGMVRRREILRWLQLRSEMMGG